MKSQKTAVVASSPAGHCPRGGYSSNWQQELPDSRIYLVERYPVAFFLSVAYTAGNNQVDSGRIGVGKCARIILYHQNDRIPNDMKLS